MHYSIWRGFSLPEAKVYPPLHGGLYGANGFLVLSIKYRQLPGIQKKERIHVDPLFFNIMRETRIIWRIPSWRGNDCEAACALFH